MSKKNRISRRGFLKGSAAAAGAAYLWLPRRTSSAAASPGRAKRLFILHAAGGMRSTCLWNAHVAPQWNPFGQVTSGDPLLPTPPAWGVGRVLLPADRTPVTLTKWANVQLPFITQLTNQIAVLGAVAHDPSAGAGDTNHYSATLRMCTGAPDGQNGLLTLISKELGNQFPLAPTIVGGAGPIGASVYGVGAGELTRNRPIYIGGPTDFRYKRVAGQAADPAYVQSLESGLDQGMADSRPKALGGRLRDFITIKPLGIQYGGVLSTDALRIAYVPTAALGTTTTGTPLTNEMLAEPFGNANLPGALGVRLLQIGAPVVAVNVPGWDLHSNEDDGLPSLASGLGRMIAALQFVLSRLPDADGKSYWDTTLIVVTSEFGRDNTSPTADDGLMVGFNRGQGSDHHGTNAHRYQALPIMGAGVMGGRLLRPTDEQVKPTAGAYATPSVLATLMRAIGIDPAPYFSAPPIADAEFYG